MGGVPQIHDTFGAVYISVVVAAAMWGASFIQTFYYFRRFSRKDGWGTKAVVIAAMLSDTLHQAFLTQTIYVYLVSYAFQPEKLKLTTWSSPIAIMFSGVTVLIVQCFYAFRIWRFSQKNIILAGSLAVVMMAGFVSGLVYTIRAINMTTFVELATLEWWTVAMNAFGAASDTLIAASFCVLLRNSRTPLQRVSSSSARMIDLLVMFFVQMGMLTSLCAIAAVIAIVASPKTFIHGFFYFIQSQLHCNSLLATLNVRDAIRSKAHGSAGISLSGIGDLSPSASDNHKGGAFKPDAESRKYIEMTKAHDGDTGKPWAGPILDEGDVGDERSYSGGLSKHIQSLHEV